LDIYEGDLICNSAPAMPDPQFTFICGDDDFIVTRLARDQFEEKARETSDEFSREIVNGMANKVAEVGEAVTHFRQAVQTMPLFGDRKVVWFRDINFLADSVTGRAEGTLATVELLKDTLARIDARSVDVILSAFPVDRRRGFPKWCEKNGDYRFIGGDRSGASSIPALIEEERQQLDVEITNDARDLLIGKLNGNTRLVIEELRKVATYLGEEKVPIEEKHIMDLVPEFGESDFFEAAEAFFALDLDWALDALRRHFYTHKDARGLITTLQGRNRLLIQLRVLVDSGEIRLGERGISKTALESAAKCYLQHFGDSLEKSNFNVFSQNPWYLGRLARPLPKLTIRKLIDFQKEFLRAFEEILSRPDEQEQVMRGIAIRCLG